MGIFRSPHASGGWCSSSYILLLMSIIPFLLTPKGSADGARMLRPLSSSETFLASPSSSAEKALAKEEEDLDDESPLSPEELQNAAALILSAASPDQLSSLGVEGAYSTADDLPGPYREAGESSPGSESSMQPLLGSSSSPLAGVVGPGLTGVEETKFPFDDSSSTFSMPPRPVAEGDKEQRSESSLARFTGYPQEKSSGEGTLGELASLLAEDEQSMGQLVQELESRQNPKSAVSAVAVPSGRAVPQAFLGGAGAGRGVSLRKRELEDDYPDDDSLLEEKKASLAMSSSSRPVEGTQEAATLSSAATAPSSTSLPSIASSRNGGVATPGGLPQQLLQNPSPWPQPPRAQKQPWLPQKRPELVEYSERLRPVSELTTVRAAGPVPGGSSESRDLNLALLRQALRSRDGDLEDPESSGGEGEGTTSKKDFRRNAPCEPACVEGHGRCVNGMCFCKSPYTGEACDEVDLAVQKSMTDQSTLESWTSKASATLLFEDEVRWPLAVLFWALLMLITIFLVTALAGTCGIGGKGAQTRENFEDVSGAVRVHDQGDMHEAWVRDDQPHKSGNKPKVGGVGSAQRAWGPDVMKTLRNL